MFRVYCDRCKKQCKRDVNFYEMAQTMNPGDYILCGLNEVVEEKRRPHNDEYPNDLKSLDICEKCQKELNEVITNFMKTK